MYGAPPYPEHLSAVRSYHLHKSETYLAQAIYQNFRQFGREARYRAPSHIGINGSCISSNAIII